MSVENNNDQQFITPKGNNVIHELILKTPNLDPARMTFIVGEDEKVKILHRPYPDEPVRPISLYAWNIGNDIAVEDGSGIYSIETARKIWIHLITECLWRAA